MRNKLLTIFFGATFVASLLLVNISYAQDWDKYKYDQGKKAQQDQQSIYNDMINQATGSNKSADNSSGSGGSTDSAPRGGGFGNICCKNGLDDFMGQGTCLDGSQPIYPCKQ